MDFEVEFDPQTIVDPEETYSMTDSVGDGMTPRPVDHKEFLDYVDPDLLEDAMGGVVPHEGTAGGADVDMDESSDDGMDWGSDDGVAEPPKREAAA